MQSFSDKRAVVTGAAAGIGRAIALRLAKEGMSLWLLDIDETGLQSVAAECRACGVEVVANRCDLSEQSAVSNQIQQLKAKWNSLDLLVNNAGIAYYGPTECMTNEQWNRLIAINLLAPIQLTRELLSLLLVSDEGHLLNVCSISGLVAGGRFAAYHASKFGLVGFTDAMRAEYSRQGLGVTTFCPGPVQTNLYKMAMHGRPDKPAPLPPRWICCSVEQVADRAVRAIRKNQRFVLVGIAAHLLWNLKKWAPAVLDIMHRTSRHRRKRAQARATAISEAQSQRRAA